MPTHGYNVKEITKHAINAINASNIANSEVAGLPAPPGTAAAFKALFVNRQTGYWTQRQDMEFHEASIDAAIAAGVFTDSNIDPLTTVDAVRNILTTANTDLSLTFQSGNRAWS
jgi:hypothetical protein